MIRHIVCWKFKEGENTAQNLEKIRRELCALVGKIEGLESLEVGFCEGGEWDAALCSTLRDMEALNYYRTHPEHVKVADFIHTILESRTAADYEM